MAHAHRFPGLASQPADPRCIRGGAARRLVARATGVVLICAAFVLLSGSPAGAIVDGTPTGAYRARNVGTLVVSGEGLPWTWAGCGVTMVSHTVGVTAGHCIAFGYRRSPFTRIGISFASEHAVGVPLSPEVEVHEGTDALHPSFKPVFGGGLPLQDLADPALADVAVIVLDKPIAGLRPARLPKPGKRRSALRGPLEIGLVGYGTTSLAAATGAAPFDGGTRRFTTMRLDTLYPAVATLSPEPGDTCFFDSGGPAFLTATGRAPKAVPSVHGIVVGPARADLACGGGTTILLLDAPHINRWLREMIAAF